MTCAAIWVMAGMVLMLTLIVGLFAYLIWEISK